MTTDMNACDLGTCEIVKLDWLLESVEAKKPLPGKGYTFDSPDGGDGGNGDGGKNGDDKSRKNGKSKKRTLEDTLHDHTDESSKKMRDGQKASSKKLVVPVDEGFYGPGKLPKGSY